MFDVQEDDEDSIDNKSRKWRSIKGSRSEATKHSTRKVVYLEHTARKEGLQRILISVTEAEEREWWLDKDLEAEQGYQGYHGWAT